MRNDSLYLHEVLLLLALRDEKGTIDASVHYPHALGGAILAECLLTNRISIDTSKKSKKVILLDSTPFGNPVLDECLEKIRMKKKPDSAQNWESMFIRNGVIWPAAMKSGWMISMTCLPTKISRQLSR